jgi:hypothetical protein
MPGRIECGPYKPRWRVVKTSIVGAAFNAALVRARTPPSDAEIAAPR